MLFVATPTKQQLTFNQKNVPIDSKPDTPDTPDSDSDQEMNTMSVWKVRKLPWHQA